MAERDSWPTERQSGDNFDPFHNDPYLTEYGNGAWHDNNGEWLRCSKILAFDLTELTADT